MINFKKKRIIILGAGGMLGHVLTDYLANTVGHDVFVTIRNSRKLEIIKRIISEGKITTDFDVTNFSYVEKYINDIKPDFIINCVGILSINDQQRLVEAIEINSLFPQKLSQICSRNINTQFIHISTDAVFDGLVGNYDEGSQVSPLDSYALTKLLGESNGKSDLVIRTSIIGHSLNDGTGLVDWLISSHNQVNGFAGYIYSGVTTIELSRILSLIIDIDKRITGVLNISSRPISKYELLKKISIIYKLSIDINELSEPQIDRSLASTRMQKLIGDCARSWDKMLVEQCNYFHNNAEIYTKR